MSFVLFFFLFNKGFACLPTPMKWAWKKKRKRKKWNVYHHMMFACLWLRRCFLLAKFFYSIYNMKPTKVRWTKKRENNKCIFISFHIQLFETCQSAFDKLCLASNIRYFLCRKHRLKKHVRKKKTKGRKRGTEKKHENNNWPSLPLVLALFSLSKCFQWALSFFLF